MIAGIVFWLYNLIFSRQTTFVFVPSRFVLVTVDISLACVLLLTITTGLVSCHNDIVIL